MFPSVLNEARIALNKWFGYAGFRPMQAEVIEALSQGRDCIVLLPTGGGKSICYQIPALIHPGCGIVISPLISLMKDQVEGLLANGIRAAFLNSSQGADEQRAVEDAFLQDELDLLYVSPEKALSGAFQSMLRSARINLFAIDEAHCISAWGHDFRPEYTQLRHLRKAFPSIPIIALTATADKVTRRDMARQLGLQDARLFLGSFDRPNLFLQVKPGLKRRQQIEAFLDKRKGQSGIIYCLSRKSTERLAEALNEKGWKAAHYHAGLDDRQRSRVQEQFIRDEVPIICATIAFGMGIDKSNVRWVIHYNLPKNLESYYQEIGRAGRDGVRADTLLFYSFNDVALLRDIIQDKEQNQAEVQLAKLDRMQEYAEALICRRRILLSYFGQEHPGACGHCDNCQQPPDYFDGTELAQKALSAVYRLRQKETIRTLINVLRGSGAREIRERGLDRIKTFGAGRHTPFSSWQFYIRQLLNQGYLELAYDEGMALKLTPASHRVLFEGEKVSLVAMETRKAKAASEKQKNKTRSAAQLRQDELFQSLRELRSRLAREQGLPPYVVFSDATLHQMVEEKPVTLEQMRTISGVGEKKLHSYGELFLDAIRTFLESNTQSIKGSTFQLTLVAYQSGKSIQQIAEARGLKPTTVVGHLQKLHQQGEAIDFRKMISPEKLRLVEQLTRYMDEPSLKAIHEGLEGKLSYLDIRLALLAMEQ